MTTINFPEANHQFVAPPTFTEGQVKTIPAYTGLIRGGSCDGAVAVVVAWLPSPEELALLNAGNPIYLTSLGGLMPHMLTTDLTQALSPS